VCTGQFRNIEADDIASVHEKGTQIDQRGIFLSV